MWAAGDPGILLGGRHFQVFEARQHPLLAHGVPVSGSRQKNPFSFSFEPRGLMPVSNNTCPPNRPSLSRYSVSVVLYGGRGTTLYEPAHKACRTGWCDGPFGAPSR